MMVSRDGAFGILIGAVVGALFLVPAHGSAQDSLSVSCSAVDPADPFADPNFTFDFLRSCAEQVPLEQIIESILLRVFDPDGSGNELPCVAHDGDHRIRCVSIDSCDKHGWPPWVGCRRPLSKDQRNTPLE